MKIKIKAIIAFVSASLCVFCPAAAKADRVYFLVGVRHVYEIGPDRDLHLAEREEIEKNYADGVSEDQNTFNKHVANGADHEKESDYLNKDLDALADARDKSLGSLFTNRDDLRESHPDLKIEGDGPYQVMGIEMHEAEGAEVFDRFAVYAPWPDYVVVGGCYGGWDYGVWYEPGIFFNLYWGWWGSFGGFRFCPGFYGHFGRVDFRPRGFVDHSRFGASSHGFGRSSAAFSRGYSHSTGAAARGWGSNGRSVSGYSHSSASGSRPSGTWNRSTRSSSSAGGYSHSSAGGFSRGTFSSSSNRSSGYSGYGRASSSSRSSGWDGQSARPARSYSHSSGSYPSGGSRSSGGFSRSSSSGGSGNWGGGHSGGSRSVGSGGSGSGGARSGQAVPAAMAEADEHPFGPSWQHNRL